MLRLSDRTLADEDDLDRETILVTAPSAGKSKDLGSSKDAADKIIQ